MIDPVVQRFAKLCEETLALSGLKTEEIESVELIGDCTRTPII